MTSLSLSHQNRWLRGRDRRDGTGGRVRLWCGWGSWGGPGRGLVQICCKGAPGRDRRREKARNINVPLRAPRRDPGLCNRFGQTAPPRTPARTAASAITPVPGPGKPAPGAETCTSHSKVQFQPGGVRGWLHHYGFGGVVDAPLESGMHISTGTGSTRLPLSRTAPPTPPRTGPGPRTTTPGEKGSLRPSRPEGARGGAARSASTSGSTVSSRGARGGGSKPRASHLFRRRTSHHRPARARGSRKRRRSAQRGGE